MEGAIERGCGVAARGEDSALDDLQVRPEQALGGQIDPHRLAEAVDDDGWRSTRLTGLKRDLNPREAESSGERSGATKLTGNAASRSTSL